MDEHLDLALPGRRHVHLRELDFLGNGITTCAGTNGGTSGHPLEGITFTYDGASTASGVAQGWAEYSAMRQ